jgi:hypothetical protein
LPTTQRALRLHSMARHCDCNRTRARTRRTGMQSFPEIPSRLEFFLQSKRCRGRTTQTQPNRSRQAALGMSSKSLCFDRPQPAFVAEDAPICATPVNISSYSRCASDTCHGGFIRACDAYGYERAFPPPLHREASHVAGQCRCRAVSRKTKKKSLGVDPPALRPPFKTASSDDPSTEARQDSPDTMPDRFTELAGRR